MDFDVEGWLRCCHASIKRPRFRPERRRQVLALIALAVGAVVVAGCASPSGSTAGIAKPSVAARVVPWVDRTAAPPAPPPSPRPAPARYPSCAAHDITARAQGSGAAAGNISTRIKLTNTSGSPCTLAGYPTRLIGVKADGDTRVLHAFHGTMFDQASAWTANLIPMESAGMEIATADGCSAINSPHPTRRGRRDAFVGEILGLPGGGNVTAQGHFDSACGVGVSRIGQPSRPAPDPRAYAGLTLSVDRPASADAGTTLRFTVTLANHSDHAVKLVPCPVYQEGIFAGRRSRQRTYRLNCATVGSIGVGQMVVYAMQIPVPTATGEAKFGWSIPEASLFNGGVLTIQ
jgi:hypothetical protein